MTCERIKHTLVLFFCSLLTHSFAQTEHVIEYFYGDKMHLIGKYDNGTKDSIWTQWFENGNIESILEYDKGELLKSVFWNDAGIKTDEFIYKSDTLHNYWSYYANGNLKIKGQSINGIQNGESIHCYENGLKRNHATYAGGNLTGKSLFWYANGNKEIEAYYFKGILHGNFYYWYENGNKKTAGIYRKGNKSGKWVRWHENGKLEEAGKYASDKKNGTWKVWSEQGKISKIITYKNGEIIKTKEIK